MSLLLRCKLAKMFSGVALYVSLLWLVCFILYGIGFQISSSILSGSKAASIIMYFIPLLVLCAFFFGYSFRMWLHRLVSVLIHNKKTVVFCLLVLQIFVIVSFGSVGLGADQECIKAAAQNPREFSDYLTRCPNNLFISFIYWVVVQTISKVFGVGFAQGVLQILNAILIDLSGYFLYKGIAKVNQPAGNCFFLLYYGLFSITGYLVIVYSDIYALFFSSVCIYFIIDVCLSACNNPSCDKLTQRKSLISLVLLGLFTAFSYEMKPSSSIVSLAAIFCLLIFGINYFGFKRTLLYLLISFIGFIVGFCLVRFFINCVMQANYSPGHAYPMSHFVAMGLTDRGGFNYADRLEMTSLGSYKAMDDRAKALIVERLVSYGPGGFLAFLLRKFAYTFCDPSFSFGQFDSLVIYNGSVFGFSAEGVLDARLFSIVRNLFTPGTALNFCVYVLQSILYLIVIAGLVSFFKSMFCFSEDTTSDSKVRFVHLVLLFSFLGSILFLLLFESGRGKYLIQFLPIYFVIASFGVSRIVSGFRLMDSR